MLSPFPGMDPYLEDTTIWPDFHTTLVVAMRADLNPRLPKGYIASTDRHVWIEGNRRRRGREPDLLVTGRKKKGAVAEGASPVAVASPRMITLPLRERKGRPYLKILDLRDRRVVTVVEPLSPSNTTARPDHEDYLAKREEYLASGVNLVEVNLLRGG